MKILGISGSLRQNSFNTRLLRTAIALAPDGVSIDEFDLSPIPLYNEDVRAAGFPPSVQQLRDAIRDADALLFATPEYNYSVPGVLKNAIDWASRPPDQPFTDKPAAVMGATVGLNGTVRAQLHLRQTLVGCNVHFINRPEVAIRGAADKFDATGLTDEKGREMVRQLVAALAEWANRIRK
jgi:chromate reductase, NAD(P)H dehydrogenase (quinone)